MHWSRMSVCATAAGLLLFSFVTPSPSWAYRPFISTDAAVADLKEVEIEIGYFTLERAKDENAFIIPRVVFNYGWFKDWELVAEFAIRRAPDAEVNVIDPGIFLKGVLKEGVLQDKDGFGFAIEAGPLLPATEKGDRKFGFEAIGILSDKLGPFTFHLNGGAGIDRATRDVVRIWGGIGELPVAQGGGLVGRVDGGKPRPEDAHGSAPRGGILRPCSP